jgi:2,3,4,5-tetrahydropyridine-2,6-dicarboxylate N-succinyltransferase
LDTRAIKTTIEDAWELREAVEAALDLLDSGAARVAEKAADGWVVNQWLKKAVLLSFRLNDMTVIAGGPGGAAWWDKVPSKFAGWGPEEFRRPASAPCPTAWCAARPTSRRGVVLMPSFVNLGAYVDEGTMVDTWATVGSCAQIGKNCHISGGAGIGGVLEPLQANPVIIEDNCFIGARSEVAEGVIVREGSVLSMGVYLGASTKIVDRATGEVFPARCRPIRWWFRAPCPASRCPTARPARAFIAPSSSSGSTSAPVPRPRSTSCCAIDRRPEHTARIRRNPAFRRRCRGCSSPSTGGFRARSTGSASG